MIFFFEVNLFVVHTRWVIFGLSLVCRLIKISLGEIYLTVLFDIIILTNFISYLVTSSCDAAALAQDHDFLC